MLRRGSHSRFLKKMEESGMIAEMEKVDISANSSADRPEKMDMEVVPKYVSLSKLEEGYHRVKCLSFTKVNKQRRVRVHFLDNDSYVIIPKDHFGYTEKNFDESDLIDINYSKKMMLHFTKDEDKKIYFHIYDFIFDPPLYYEDSRFRELPAFGSGTYKVLFFSVVKKDGKDRIRVDVNPIHHFILPENDRTIKIEKLDYWNKQRLMVDIGGFGVDFCFEEDFPYNHRKLMCEPQYTDEEEDE